MKESRDKESKEKGLPSSPDIMENTTREGGIPNPGNAKEGRKIWNRELFWFLLFTLIVSAVTIWRMESANSCMRAGHDRIVKTNGEVQSELRDSLLALYKSALEDSTLSEKQRDLYARSIDSTVTSLINRNHTDRANDILEMEFSKIQNEYEVLNLWCALLTVVFLIFSFFSIFKTNEMTRQGEEALEALKTTSREAKTKSDSIEEQVTKAEERIGKKENEIVAGLNKKIEDLNKGLSANGKNLEDLEGRVSSQSDIIKDLEGKKNAVIVDIEEKVKDLEDKLYDKINRAITSQSDLKLKTFSDTIVDLQNSQDALRDMVIGVMSQIKITDSIEAENSMQEEMDDMDIREEEPEDEEKTDEIESKSEDTCHNPAN